MLATKKNALTRLELIKHCINFTTHNNCYLFMDLCSIQFSHIIVRFLWDIVYWRFLYTDLFVHGVETNREQLDEVALHYIFIIFFFSHRASSRHLWTSNGFLKQMETEDSPFF